MTTKRKRDLGAALSGLDDRAPTLSPRASAEPPKRVEQPVAPAPEAAPQSPHKRPSRAGKSMVAGYFEQLVLDQLEDIRIANKRAGRPNTTNQALIREALNDLFAKYGKPEIA